MIFHKIAAITGGSEGPGLHMANALRLAGWAVYNLEKCSRDPDFIPCDVTNEPSCRLAALKTSDATSGRVFVLINNYGVGGISQFDSLPATEWDRLLDNNLKGIFNVSRAFLPMLEKNAGVIVNMIYPEPKSGAVYNASVAAARSLTERMGRELPVTVFGLEPRPADPDRTPNALQDKAMSELLVYLLSRRRNHRYLSGCILPYGAM